MRTRTSFLEDFAILLRSCRSTGSGLADLLAQGLTGVPHTLVLVRIGRAEGPNVCGYLTDHLLVVSAEHQVGLLVDLKLDPGRQQNLDGMRIAKGKSRDVALDVGALADT